MGVGAQGAGPSLAGWLSAPTCQHACLYACMMPVRRCARKTCTPEPKPEPEPELRARSAKMAVSQYRREPQGKQAESSPFCPQTMDEPVAVSSLTAETSRDSSVLVGLGLLHIALARFARPRYVLMVVMLLSCSGCSVASL